MQRTDMGCSNAMTTECHKRNKTRLADYQPPANEITQDDGGN